MSIGSDIGSSQISTAFHEHQRLPVPLGCPRCHCNAVHRSRRRGLDWIMSAMGFRPARCFTCAKRFYTREFQAKAQS